MNTQPKTNSNFDLLTNKEDIYRILITIAKKRSVVSLRFVDNPNKFYSSMILDVNFNSEAFIIDAVNNTEINNRLAMGENFDLLGFDGLPITLSKNTAMRSTMPEWPSAFIVAFPTAIDYRQRRQAFRAEVLHSELSSIQLTNTNTGQRIEGKASNLSASGIGVNFEHSGPNQDNEMFPHCHITIPGGLDIHCSVVSKHPRLSKNTGSTSCGLEFIALDQLQQKMVDRCVLSLQRQAKLFQQRAAT